MNSNSLVSVLIPVYNVEKYVKEAVESIQKQTYKNIEIIVIDDGSTDETYNIVNSLAINDSRIKLYRNDENLRIVKTLNRALELASGKYILRMDGDDISELDRIEKKLFFLENNIDIDLVGCSAVTIDTNGNKISMHKSISDFDLIKRTIKYGSPVSHIWLARRNVYDKLNGYKEVSGAEDYDFLLRMLSFNMRFTNMEEYYGYYIRKGREGNTVNTNGLNQYKLQVYLYSLYLTRLKTGEESLYDLNEIKTSLFSKKLFYWSSVFHQKALENFGKKKHVHAVINFALSLISPYKINYYFSSIKYKVIVRLNKNES